MLRTIKTAITTGVHIAGFDIRRIDNRYRLLRRRLWGKDFIADLREIAKRQGEPIRTVFVIGAFQGGGAREILSSFPDAQVHCFEPDPRTYMLLCDKLQAYPNAYCHQLAVGDCLGQLQLHLTQDRTTNSLLVPNPDEAPTLSSEVGSIEVEVTTLDAFCERENIDQVDFVLCDVQGYELHLLRGARRLLGEQRITTILLEACFDAFYLGQASLAQLYEFMTSSGYRFVCMQGLFFDDKPYPRSGNAIFTKGQ